MKPSSLKIFIRFVMCAVAAIATTALVSACNQHQLDSRLIDAAYSGDLGLMKSSILLGANPNCRGVIRSSIHIKTSFDLVREYFACQNPSRQQPVLLIALSSGGDVTTPNRNEIVRLLVQHGALPDAQGPKGNTALIFVCDDVDATRYLLEHGANPNLCNSDRVTALMVAACSARVETVTLLLAAGADTTIKTKFGYTAESMVRQMLSNGEAENRSQCRQILDLLARANKANFPH